MSASDNHCAMTLRVRLRWWLRAWVYAVVTLNHLTGWVPSDLIRDRIIRRGVYVEHVE